jgi:hypothetical protein
MSKPRGSRGSNTSKVELLFMIEWLEEPPGNNFKLITGDAQSMMTSVVAESKLKKTDANASLANHVNRKRNIKDEKNENFWTKTQAEARYRAMLDKFKKTKKAK